MFVLLPEIQKGVDSWWPPHFAFFPTLLHFYTPSLLVLSLQGLFCARRYFFFSSFCDAGKRKESHLKRVEGLEMENLSNTALEPPECSIWPDNLIKLQLQIIGKTFTNHCDLVFACFGSALSFAWFTWIWWACEFGNLRFRVTENIGFVEICSVLSCFFSNQTHKSASTTLKLENYMVLLQSATPLLCTRKLYFM